MIEVGYLSEIPFTTGEYRKRDIILYPCVNELVAVTGIFDLDCIISKYLLGSVSIFDHENQQIKRLLVNKPTTVNVQSGFFDNITDLRFGKEVINQNLIGLYKVSSINCKIKIHDYTEHLIVPDQDIDAVYPNRWGA